MRKVRWIASRTYRITLDNGANDTKDVFVGISRPFKLTEAEILSGVTPLGYGCVIQTGPSFTRRIVRGSDELEALFHGILSIDHYLWDMSKRFQLVDSDNNVYSIKSDGLLGGPIGVRYINDQKKGARGKAKPA